jgi:hypothetical protein
MSEPVVLHHGREGGAAGGDEMRPSASTACWAASVLGSSNSDNDAGRQVAAELLLIDRVSSERMDGIAKSVDADASREDVGVDGQHGHIDVQGLEYRLVESAIRNGEGADCGHDALRHRNGRLLVGSRQKRKELVPRYAKELRVVRFQGELNRASNADDGGVTGHETELIVEPNETVNVDPQRQRASSRKVYKEISVSRQACQRLGHFLVCTTYQVSAAWCERSERHVSCKPELAGVFLALP